MRGIGGTIVGVAMLTLAGTVLAAPSDGDPAQALRGAIKSVDRATRGSQGFALDSRAGVPLLAQQWRAVRQLAIATLDRQPGIGEAALEKRLRQAGLAQVQVVRLDAAAVLVGSEAGAFGTFSLLARGPDGHFRVALALDRPTAGGPAHLAAWRPDRSVAGCSAPAEHGYGATCGPMTVADTQPLAPEADGTRRFALLGRYVKGAGATDVYQLSIWRWDGRKATPLAMREFAQMADEPIFVHGSARGLTLHVKGAFKSFMACGACAGRQMEWRFALPPEGVTPPAIRSLTPDLDAVDAVFDRLLHARPADDLAAPAVIAALTPVMQDIRDKARTDHADPSLGLLGSWKRDPLSGGSASLCLSTDATDPQIFRIEKRRGRRFVAAVRAADAQACEGPGARS